MITQAYLIETITNLHVGDLGDAGSIIDKSVQRDALTNFPTVFATSLKGAIRNHAEKQATVKNMVDTIFGAAPPNPTAGTYRFCSAHTLFYPVRSNSRPYYLATCPAMLRDGIRMLNMAERKDMAEPLNRLIGMLNNREAIILTENGPEGNAIIEHLLAKKTINTERLTPVLKSFSLSGEHALAIISDREMCEIMSDLPVVARNQLNNGISGNLWYEEFVPRRTFLLTLIMMPKREEAFENMLLSDHIQIGANATVGYGVCKFYTLGEGA